MDGSPGKVAVVGQGYVGLPLAMRAVEVGYCVVGVDADETRMKRLGIGESYVDDISSLTVRWALDTGRYLPTDDYRDAEGFDVCVITVPTPLRDGAPDLSYVESAGAAVGPLVRRGAVVVLESTTYPGTTERILKPILERMSGLRAPTDFFLGYSPERIDPGNRDHRLVNTPKVVSGIDDSSLQRVRAFYDTLVERTVPVSTAGTAELVKLFENTFRHVNIALVNELAVLAGELGIDIWEAVEAAATKPFGFMPFYPGPGVGGHCLPIDPSYLSWEVRRAVGQRFRFIELANDINAAMPQYVVHRITVGLNTRRVAVNGSRILLLGLAYKKNVADLRESPAIDIAEALLSLGAVVRAVEPHAGGRSTVGGVELVELTEEAVRAVDVVVILADHDCFDFELVSRAGRYVFDTRNRCSGGQVERL